MHDKYFKCCCCWGFFYIWLVQVAYQDQNGEKGNKINSIQYLSFKKISSLHYSKNLFWLTNVVFVKTYQASNLHTFSEFSPNVYIGQDLPAAYVKFSKKRNRQKDQSLFFLSENADCNKMMLLGILFFFQKFTFFKYTKTRSFLLLWTAIFVTDIT